MAINDTAQLAVIGTVGGVRHIHTLHFRHLDPALTEQNVIDAWQAQARTAYRDLFHPSDLPIERYVCAQVCGSVPLRAPVEEVEVDPNRAGTLASTGQLLPTFNAAVVSVRTALAGRSRRGRFFLGGLREDYVAGNVLDPNYLSRVQTYINALLAAFGPSGSVGSERLVVHSRKLASSPTVACQDSSTLVQGMIARANPGTMRSRKLGSGT